MTGAPARVQARLAPRREGLDGRAVDRL